MIGSYIIVDFFLDDSVKSVSENYSPIIMCLLNAMGHYC